MDKEQKLFFDALLSAFAERKKDQEKRKVPEDVENAEKPTDNEENGKSDNES